MSSEKGDVVAGRRECRKRFQVCAGLYRQGVNPVEMAPPTGEDEELACDHLQDLEDGCGCAEVWEHLSERRAGGD